MPQPRKQSASSGTRRNGGRRGTPAKRPSRPPRAEKLEERVAEASEAAADGVADVDPDVDSDDARKLTPFDLIVLTRDRVQEVVDDAVERGRMTRADGANLVAELLSLGRRQTTDMLADIEQLLGRSREQLTDRAKRAVGAGGGLPIAGYDELTAAQVIERVGELTPADLRKLRDYERRNANRKTVLDAIEEALG